MKEVSDVALRISELMTELGLSQGEFSAKVGIAQGNLSAILNGRRPARDGIINKIVIGLGVSKNWLSYGTPPKYSEESYERLKTSRKAMLSFNHDSIPKDIGGKIMQTYNYLYAVGKVSSIDDFTAKIRYTKIGVSKAFDSDEKYTGDVIKKIVNAFPEVNAAFFFDDSASMLINSIAINSEIGSPVAAPLINGVADVVVVPERGNTIYLAEYLSTGNINNLETVKVAVDTTFKGRYLVFDKDGDALDNGSSDSILDGDRLLGTEVLSPKWNVLDTYKKCKYYAIITRNQGTIIRKISVEKINDGFLTCKPINPMYSDLGVSIKDVIGVFCINYLINRKLNK